MIRLDLQFFGGRGSSGGANKESVVAAANTSKPKNEFSFKTDRAAAISEAKSLPTGSLVQIGSNMYRKDGRGENGYWRNARTFEKVGEKGVGFSGVILEESNGLEHKKMTILRRGK